MTKMATSALTAPQAKAWDMTRSTLAWKCPGFLSIFYNMCNNAGSKDYAIFTKEIPIAATDGDNIILNPDTFFKYNNNERVFISAHEVLHCVFDHCGLGLKLAKAGQIKYPDGTILPYDDETMNIAMDLVINDILVVAGIGTAPKDCFHDPKLVTSMDSCIDAYRTVYKKKGGTDGNGKKPGKPGNQPGPAGSGFDQHLKPGTSQGKDATEATNGRDDVAWKTAVAGAARIEAENRKQGDAPGAFERFVEAFLTPAISWQEHLQALAARALGTGGWDWQRPDNELIVRDIYAPARSGFGCGTVVVGCDTSGSIQQPEIDMFFAEITGILEDVKPENLIIMWCDAAVHRVDECDDASDLFALRKKAVGGGGGTDFKPVFARIEEMGLRPDALLYLTDGCGGFPRKKPNYQVIWGNIYEPMKGKYPFGDEVFVPKQVA